MHIGEVAIVEASLTYTSDYSLEVLVDVYAENIATLNEVENRVPGRLKAVNSLKERYTTAFASPRKGAPFFVCPTKLMPQARFMKRRSKSVPISMNHE